MPLFKSHHEPEPVHHSPSNSSPSRKGTLFGRRRSLSSERSVNESTRSHRSGGGLFGSGNHRRSSSEDRHRGTGNGSVRSGNSGGGFLGFGGHNSSGNDPSIMAARQKVQDAEQAEKEADHALHAARASVREAIEHVKFLEKEAAEDARRAKAKQAEAKVVSKTASALGRHG